MTHEEYVKIITASALTLGKDAVIIYIKKTAPILLSPILNPITMLVVSKIIEILITKTEFAVFFLYIDTRTNHQGKIFSEMAHKNKNAQENGTELEKTIARENLENAFRNFIKLSN